MDNDSYNLPHQTGEILKAFRPDEASRNMGLLLKKYMAKSIFSGSGKSEWLSSLLKTRYGEKLQNTHIDPELARSLYQRWLAMMRALNIKPFSLEVDWRMVVGLGGESVLETAITLHHLYGIPFIPGSALKGLTRAYATGAEEGYYVPEGKPKAERKPSLKEETDHPDIKRIFGTQEKAGTVLFFDAMPVDCQWSFLADIMNPHYPDYYGSLQSDNIKAPTNDQSPIPVPFL